MLNRRTHTLVELSVSPQGHSGLVSSVHTVNVVSLDLLNLIHSYVTSKWDLVGVISHPC